MFDLFYFDFLQRAFFAGIAVAIAAPTIGAFLVMRRYSLMADTLAHVSLVGIAVGILTAVHPVFAAAVTTVLGAVGIEYLRKARGLSGESVLAIFLSGSLALAVVLVSAVGSLNVNFTAFLFGSIVTVSPTELWAIIGLAIFTVVAVAAFAKEFFLVSLDDELAAASGIRAGLFGTLIVALAALTIALALRVVGALLIGALIVIPVMTAAQWTQSFRATILAAILFAVAAVSGGLFLSYTLDLASGGTIVLVALALFFVTLFLTRGRR